MRRLATLLPVAVLGSLLVGPVPAEASASLTWVTAGAEGGPSTNASVSKDGKLVVFESLADNLVPGDTNEASDIFLFNRETQKLRRISVSSSGAQANDDSGFPSISADGKVVVFDSDASNLVAGDTNDDSDVFVRLLGTNKTQRVSLNNKGKQGNDDSYSASLTANGKVVAFLSDATNLAAGDTNARSDVYLRNRGTAKTRRVSLLQSGKQPNGDSYDPAISADGLFVAFASDASNLVTGDANGTGDVFLYSSFGGKRQMALVSRGSGGKGNDYSETPSVSSFCRPRPVGCHATVAFMSYATNLVAGDTNQAADIFVRAGGKTKRVSVASSGAQGGLFQDSTHPSISRNGRVIVFASAAHFGSSETGYVDIFRRNLKLKTTKLLSRHLSGSAEGDCEFPRISPDGTWVVYDSIATNLDNGIDGNLTFDVFLDRAS